MLSLRRLSFTVLRHFCRISRSKHCNNHSALSFTTLSDKYQTLIQSNKIQYDSNQERVAKHLDTLHLNIQHYNAPTLPDKPIAEASAGTFDKTFDKTKQSKPKSGIFNKILNSITKPTNVWTPPAAINIPNSLYIWGGTGTGKTMLMDLFYDSITSHSKYRAHFNTFMLELHAEIHQIEQNSPNTKLSLDEDILPQLSLNIAKKSTILYLDEFQVTDLVDALLLNRLLTSLFHYGGICLLTSNREPDMLYLNGLQRDKIWLPFLRHFQQKCMVIDLNTVNYRDLGYGYGYFLQRQYFESVWKEISACGEEMKVISVMAGRQLRCDRCVGNNVVRFNFRELCAMSKGSADYLALSKSFDTIFIEDIPVFGYDPNSRNEMKRFIWLIDELYNGKNHIVCLAAERPEMLLQGDEEDKEKYVFEEVFQFERCKKRLIEMQSSKYWEMQTDRDCVVLFKLLVDMI